jgi:undecaprenyl-diphosphatase
VRFNLSGQAGSLRTLAAVLAHSGDSWFWLAGLGLLWWLGPETWQDREAVFLIGVALTALVVMAIKLLVRRRRPEGEWGSLYRRTDPHSFPSGHAARCIALAVMAAWTGPAWLALALWIWAPLVAAARALLGVHYLSDVVAGALLGVITGAITLLLT